MRIKTVGTLGELVRGQRKQRGWSQSQLAEKVGVSRLWVGQFEIHSSASGGGGRIPLGRSGAQAIPQGRTASETVRDRLDKLVADTDGIGWGYADDMRYSVADLREEFDPADDD
jgi:transcriptional regulator with XRE-family HTH domain